MRDPDFEVKATRVLDLYAHTCDGAPLTFATRHRTRGADEYVISADEKPSIQARDRCHATAPAGPRRPMRVNHDYRRRGALAYLAAYDVHHAWVFGRCEQSTGIDPFTRLVDQVMTAEPYASAKRVFFIVDNGSSQRGQAASRAHAMLRARSYGRGSGGTVSSLGMKSGKSPIVMRYSTLLCYRLHSW
ncbi:hypothetical protein [Rhodococcus pseudokoreensis]|uniref:hypothetical protein n=1 Tax=Rhodococcus pseudokoreensis TaxID=2811421 RepID=UPI0030841EC8